MFVNYSFKSTACGLVMLPDTRWHGLESCAPSGQASLVAAQPDHGMCGRGPRHDLVCGAFAEPTRLPLCSDVLDACSECCCECEKKDASSRPLVYFCYTHLHSPASYFCCSTMTGNPVQREHPPWPERKQITMLRHTWRCSRCTPRHRRPSPSHAKR